MGSSGAATSALPRAAFSSFSPSSSSLFLPEQRLRDGHGACGVRLTPAGCQGLGAGGGGPGLPHSPLLLPLLRLLLLAVDREDSHGAAAQYREEDGRLLVGRRLGFEDAGVGVGDSVQGRVEAIRGASTAGKGRRPWGRRWLAPAPRPPRCVTGKRNREIGIRMVADGWGPLGSERKRKVGKTGPAVCVGPQG
jgi:hypothetical protein